MRSPQSVSVDPAKKNAPSIRRFESHRDDRRRTQRLPLYGGSFAVLHDDRSTGNKETLAQILDISIQGIAFRFFANAVASDRITCIDITLPNQGVALKGLPVQAIYETEDRNNPGGRPTRTGVRRLGLRFAPLPHPKAKALHSLISRFACGRPD